MGGINGIIMIYIYIYISGLINMSGSGFSIFYLINRSPTWHSSVIEFSALNLCMV